jgi:hypothetical protein
MWPATPFRQPPSYLVDALAQLCIGQPFVRIGSDKRQSVGLLFGLPPNKVQDTHCG